MSKRFAWLLAAALILVGFLLACGSTYNHASDGLVLITSQGTSLVQTYSFSLASGSMASVSNSVNDTASETCGLPGIPGSVILDPAGAYLYVIVQGNAECPVSGGGAGPNGIQAFTVNSDGTITATGNLVPDPNPTALAMDSSGKYLFVAEGLTTGSPISVYSVSSGTLTNVPQTFTLPPTGIAPNYAALTVSPTVFPPVINGINNAVCSTSTAPTSEYVYLVDSASDVVWELGVNSSGVLGLAGAQTAFTPQPTGSVPMGVVVDPCDRFVYVTDNISNQISAYYICNGGNTQNQQNPPKCPATPDGSLYPITGSPFSNSGNATYPGPMVIDAYANFLYVLNGSNSITPFSISSVNGKISPLTPPVVATGSQPKAIAIRSDDTWLFVTNFNPPTLSQYSVTPASGALTPFPQTTTDNYPYGLAVK